MVTCIDSQVFIDKHRHEKVELLNKMDCGVRGGPPLPHLPQVLHTSPYSSKQVMN